MDDALLAVLSAPRAAPAATRTPEELLEEQQEEVETLRAIYDGAFSTPAAGVYRLTVEAREDDARWQSSVDLTFCFGESYPDSAPPVLQLAAGGDLSRVHEDELTGALMASALERLGAPMVFDLALEAQEFLEARVAERKRERAEADARQARRDRRKQRGAFVAPAAPAPQEPEPEPEDLDDLRAEYRDRMAVAPAADYQPGMFITRLPELFRLLQEEAGVVTHIENVLRQDLAHRFVQCARGFDAHGPADYVQAFHGTSAGVVGRIAAMGLVVPGSHGVGVANGSALGNGIYLSESPGYSCSYSSRGGDAAASFMFICAAVPGEPGVDHNRSGHAYCVFSAAQVLPCYVVHFRARAGAGAAAGGRPALTVTQSGLVAVAGANAEEIAEAREFSRLREHTAAMERGRYFFGRGRQILAVASDDDDDDLTAYGEVEQLVDVDGGIFQEERYALDEGTLSAVMVGW